MGIVELVFLALGVSMDAFAVSVCKGLALRRADWRSMGLCGLWFGVFQAAMPLAGYLLGAMFAGAIEAFDHWVAFGLLAIIGVNMLREALSSDGGGDGRAGDLSPKTMAVLAVATSIDALAVGISLAMAGDVDILAAVALIGVVTFAMSAVGVKLGSVFGDRFEKKAQVAGGLILIGLGLEILLEHLGVIG